VQKLTQRVVSAVKPEPKERFVWDSELKGFGLRVSPKGRKSFFVQYRVGSSTRRMRIGTSDVLKAEAARRKAQELLGSVQGGADPSKDREALRTALRTAAE
jgi:hypothetical protein